ncbi:MAG: hypothetical protein ACFCAD_18045 [Pleurocapsa sp.]
MLKQTYQSSSFFCLSNREIARAIAFFTPSSLSFSKAACNELIELRSLLKTSCLIFHPTLQLAQA